MKCIAICMLHDLSCVYDKICCYFASVMMSCDHVLYCVDNLGVPCVDIFHVLYVSR